MADFPGAERLVRFHIDEVRRSSAVLPFRWSDVEMAPQFAQARAAQAKRAEGGWQVLKVMEVREEAAGVRSFLFASADGLPLPRFAPGQHLTLRLPIAGQDRPLVRNYTVSDASNGRSYRITVKRAGLASSWLHDQVREGMTLEAMPPRGSFVFDATSPRPIVLLSAGTGITPMLAILNSLLNDHLLGSVMRQVYFIHGARHAADRPFVGHLREAVLRYPALTLHFVNSEDGAAPGRVDLALLKRLLPFNDYDFYLCGPGPFMRDLYEGLRGMMIPDERIRFESFGPSSVTRTTAPKDTVTDVAAAKVVFARSQRTLGWTLSDGSLLELAEAHGVPMQSDCRAGSCGTCAVRLVSGKVRYLQPVEAELETGQVLACSCAPQIAEDGTTEPVVLDV
ncbi:MAG: 2Fe-2S iron-sulfur cluster binding domain-containing protein [Burkholderiales bacterium]|nr:2Fe-2S iron-sulfur cluster binding domain-containing protein [Burkholderiales bacterium]